MEIELPQDFKEFLRFINANQVEYLLVSGYLQHLPEAQSIVGTVDCAAMKAAG
jgi:hypothetical protein